MHRRSDRDLRISSLFGFRHWNGSQTGSSWISTSKSKAMKLSQESPLWVGREAQPQAAGFKYPGILNTSEGNTEIDMQIGVAAKVIRTVMGLLQ